MQWMYEMRSRFGSVQHEPLPCVAHAHTERMHKLTAHLHAASSIEIIQHYVDTE